MQNLSNFKFIHAADLHIDSPLKGLDKYEGAPVEEVRLSTRKAFQNLVELAIKEQVKFVLLVGDIFDGDWTDFSTGLFFSSELTKLRDKGVSVFLLHGNHDAANKVTRSVRLPDNVSIFSHKKSETLKIEDLRVALHGQSFEKESMTDDLAANYPSAISGYLNVGLLHTSANGRPGHDNYAPCSIETLVKKGYDYWALGHIHKREILREDPWIVFPGNTQGRHMKEVGEKGCTLVNVRNGKIDEVRHVPLDLVRWKIVECDLTGAETPLEAQEMIREKLSQEISKTELILAIRLKLIGETQAYNYFFESADAWKSDLRAVATDASVGRVWLEKIETNLKPPFDLGALQSSGGPIATMISEIENLKAQDQSLLNEFADLEKLLPDDLKLQPDEQMEALLNDAKSVLMTKVKGLSK